MTCNVSIPLFRCFRWAFSNISENFPSERKPCLNLSGVVQRYRGVHVGLRAVPTASPSHGFEPITGVTDHPAHGGAVPSVLFIKANHNCVAKLRKALCSFRKRFILPKTR